jgi:hypothetical protein
MSQPDFYAVLDDCLARLRLGEAPEACLADYPEQADRLGPPLALSAELLQLPRLEPAPEIMAQGYEAMMGVVAGERPSWTAGIGSLAGKLLASLGLGQTGRLSFALRAAVLTLVVIFASAAFVITASADSLPGDRLYPVKRTWENARLALTLAEPARQALRSEFAEQRREEVQAVLELRRPVIVEFEGRLGSIEADVWLVDGLSVTVGDGTVVSGVVVVGQEILVRAQAQRDGVLLALEIVGDEDGPPAPDGSRDGSVSGDEAQPTGRPQPTREPTRTPEPTDRPTSRPTREPTATRQPTPEPTATRTPEPKDNLTDSVAATPDERPTATPTEEPANVTRPHDEPTRDTKATPEPTATHRPTDAPSTTDKPTPEPTAPHEPRPTETKESDSLGDGSDRPP